MNCASSRRRMILLAYLRLNVAAAGEAADADQEHRHHRQAGDRGEDEQRIAGHGQGAASTGLHLVHIGTDAKAAVPAASRWKFGP